jgi:hypothetical protein
MIWIESFVFTEEPPVEGVDPDSYPITARSGIFLVPGYPQRLLFGAYVELALDEQEHGSFVVEADIEILSTDHTATIATWPINIPEPDDGWNLPRYRVLPLTIDYVPEVDSEVVVSLWTADERFCGFFRSAGRRRPFSSRPSGRGPVGGVGR